MSADILLEIEGVEGESSKKQKHLDLLSWSWGMSNHGSMHLATGGGSGKVNVSDITFVKHVDKASGRLMLACCNGEHFKKATLICRKADGDKSVEYIKIKMEDVMVTNFSAGDSAGGDLFSESVSLNFAKVTYEYMTQDKTGKGQSAGNFGWNIAEGKKV